MRAFIFPGQGSQAVGMGKAAYDAFTEAREVFGEVDEVLKQKLTKLMFEGPIEELTFTENAQPALMACSIALLRVLMKQGGKSLPELCSFVAGHSLGEYTALCAAGAISLADTATLLRIRGNAMQAACPKGKGGMAAVLGLELAQVEVLCKQAAEGEVLQLANDNSPGQVVISGSAAAIARGEAIAKAAGAKRYLPLNVSAPFHSALMQPAAKVMRQALGETPVKAPAVKLVANVTADIVTDPEKIRDLLVEQVTGRVRWTESVQKLASSGVTQTVEIGSGKVLTGLTGRIVKDMEAIAIQTPQDIEAFLKSL